ncbi:ABC transporter permease [Planctomycetota bacterium]
MTTIWNDIKFSIRQLKKAPGFTLITVLTLALGVGVNAAVFGVLYRVVLKPLPYPQSDRLVQVKMQSQAKDLHERQLCMQEYQSLTAECQGFEAIAGYAGEIRTLSGVRMPRRVFGTRVSPGFAEMFGCAPVLGRLFAEQDFSVEAQPVVLIGHRLWQDQFSGDPKVLGQTLLIDKRPAMVCGVLPADFSFPYANLHYYRPLIPTTHELQATDDRCVSVVGRLATGVSLKQAQDELQRISAGYHTAYAVPDKDRVHFTGTVFIRERIGSAGRILWILFGAVSCVTLIGMSNLFNLFLSRLLSRRQELSVRLALGADSWRLTRQWITESGLISLLAGAVGVIFADWSIQLLRTFAPYELPRKDEIAVDVTITAYAFGLSIFMGVGISVVLLLRFLKTKQNQNTVLKSFDRQDSRTGRRSRTWLITSQATLATVLLIGAGLLWHSFRNVSRIDPGYVSEHLLSARMVMPAGSFPEDTALRGFYRQVDNRLRTLPGVTDVGIVNSLPLSEMTFKRPFLIKPNDQTATLTNQEPLRGNFTSVSLNYFRLFGIPLRKGRLFQPTDENGGPVVIISESLAQRFFGHQDPVGQQFKIGPGKWRPWMTIVGVVADVKSHGRDVPNQPTFYVPYIQQHLPTYTMRGMFVVVKTHQTPEVMVNRLRAEMSALNPDLALANIQTMEDRLFDSAAQRRYHSGLMGVMAALALGLVILGIFGVLSRTVADRQREMGIRLALGSDKAGIFRLILKQGLKPVVVGVLLGWCIAFALRNVLAGFLFGVSPHDPKTFLLVGLILLASAVLACYIPARKATRFDPMEALRYE